jgi:eukaryotic-like serine/threonine-protein kinase
VKIIDFGIAKAANRSQKTQAGILKGKFGYMSPEQVRGLEIDRRSDIFAVGVIIYEMLTGEKLFVGESDFSTLERVRNADVPTPRQFNPNIPTGLEKVVLKSLARDAEDRYQWASDLQEDLMRFLLAGDAIYSAKHLSAFMKEAFAEDLLRENEKMERFASVEKPEQVEASGVTASPRFVRRTPLPSAPPGPTVPNPARRHQEALSPGTGAIALGPQSAKVDAPVPTDEELESARDRTVIVDNAHRDHATAIGPSPFGHEPAGAFDPTLASNRALRAEVAALGPPHSALQNALSQLQHQQAADRTLVPGPGLLESPDNDLKPIDSTGIGLTPEPETASYPVDGLRAQSTPEDEERSDTSPERGNARPQVIIGHAPIVGATAVGPSPFAQVPETRVYRPDTTGESQRATPEEEDAPVTTDSHDFVNQATNEHQAQVRPDLPAALEKASAREQLERKRKGLLLAIGATALMSLAVIVAALVKMTATPKSLVIITSTPKDVPFSVLINPGQLKIDRPSQPIELEPGEYTFEFKALSPGYLSSKRPLSLRVGKTLPILVTFTKSEPEVPVVKAAPQIGSISHSAEIPAKTSWSLSLTCADTGIAIAVDETPRGMCPVALTELTLGKTYEIKATKAGFQDQRILVSNPDERESVVRTLSLLPLPALKKDPEPPSGTQKNDPALPKTEPAKVDALRAEAQVKKEAAVSRTEGHVVPKSKGGLGKVAFTSKPIGAELWIDGKDTGRKTPVPQPSALELPLGKHKVVFKLEGKTSQGYEFEVTDAHKDKPLIMKGEL